jgi:hypothetical protein
MRGQRYEAGDQVKVTGLYGPWFGVVVADSLNGTVRIEVTYPGRGLRHKGQRVEVGTATVTKGEWIFDPDKERYWSNVS